MSERYLRIICDVRSRIARYVPRGKDTALSGMITAALIGSWALGRLSVISEVAGSRLVIENVFDKATDSFICQASIGQGGGGVSGNTGVPNTVLAAPGAVVVSSRGTKYHFAWCSGAKSIKEENKVWFESEQAALDAGYTKAGNCK